MSTIGKSPSDVCSVRGSETAPSNKITSCEQKKKDGVCENNSRITNTTSSIDDVSNDLIL